MVMMIYIFVNKQHLEFGTMDVVVVGSCMIDLISYVPRLPKPGETLHGNRFATGFGGKGANQCVVASRLGARAAMVAKVGDDRFGHDYIQNFKDNNVNTDHVGITKEAATGMASIAVTTDGVNAIIIVAGANMKLSVDDIKNAEDVISKAKVVLCQLEIDQNVTLAAIQLAKQHNVTTILNPAPGKTNILPELYTSCDILCPNEVETEILTGIPVISVHDAYKALDILLDRGCRTVIITLGSQGVVYARSDDRKAVHVAARKVQAVDTTGAGDAFVGTLAFCLAAMPGTPLEEIIQKSNEVATISVQSLGTQTSYPWNKDLPSDLLQSSSLTVS